jgi:hypothetical protein
MTLSLRGSSGDDCLGRNDGMAGLAVLDEQARMGQREREPEWAGHDAAFATQAAANQLAPWEMLAGGGAGREGGMSV